MRAFNIIRELTAGGATVEVVSLAHDSDEATQVVALGRVLPARFHAIRTTPWRNYLRGVVALPGARPLTHSLLDAPGMHELLRDIVAARPPDVVLAFCSGMARFALEAPLERYPAVIDFIDIDSAKWAALATTTFWPLSWIYRREARCLGRFEAAAAGRTVTSVVINERERLTLAAMAAGADIRVIGIGVDLKALHPPAPPSEEPRVVFCGVMDYKPNAQGSSWFVHEVWPLVRARRPDAHLTIVGANPTATVRHLASEQAGVEVTGSVPDVRDYLWRSAVSIAPLLVARGLQNKVLEALAAGLPAVVTTGVMKGLPATVLPGCLVADSPQSFADAVVDLLAKSGAERRAFAARARLDLMTWAQQLAPLSGVLSEAAGQSVRQT
jgi:sugar transferase (PEP-CTERM/EpsH1 system associated)